MTIHHLKDPFAPDSNYDIAKFYTAASDDKTGKTVQLRLSTVNIPLRIMSHMAQIIEQRKVPQYETKLDIVRDALHHRLHWVGEETRNGPLLHDLNVAGLASLQQQRRNELLMLEELVDNARATCGRAFLADDDRLMAEQVEDMEAMVDSLPEPYNGQIQQLVRKFKPMVKHSMRKSR